MTVARLLPSVFNRRGAASSTETSAATLLLWATAIAVLWANSPWGYSYSAFWSTPIGITFGDTHAELTAKEIVNDGLMAFFFFVVGLEVKSEFIIGELTDRARARVPVVAALAGMILPAAIFLLFNPSGDNARAWGVVISTDTAFLIGALAVIAPKYPARLRTFLLTLAIVDDVGALLVIAVFYSAQVRMVPLLIALGLIVLIRLVTYLPTARTAGYAVGGFALWLALFRAGVHPTLAGVAVALLIRVFTPERERVERAVELIRAFRQSPNSEYARAATRTLRDSLSINERLRTAFTPFVSFTVLPLFALANAGVRLDQQSLTAAVRSPLAWGIAVGLVVGKLVGISGATAIVCGIGLGQLAPGLTQRRVAGGAALCGIGFTIALFIVDIAISDPRSQDLARIGVLTASVIAFALGWVMFRLTDKLWPPKPVGLKLVRPVDPDRDHIRGDPAAPLTLVEYGDYECPFCSRATGSIDEVREYFGDQLRYVWRHLPLERVHPHAFGAAWASEAAHMQGRFWEMAQTMFANQNDLEWPDIYRYANNLGLDLEKFNDDIHSSAVRHRVEDDALDAEVMDLSSTPTFFVGGKRHKGPFDAATLIRALEASRVRD
ncbi:Na+/H+ antiporter NhaA [Mycobacterium sp.]|jgi:Na+/H+ antiporter NhaA|uniref:Na+/H+ antiporter NhaA n=1 Tax=Mycobacterium sp. TaxID=1785 RepID=UPI002D49E177|nr:Na+/H+ antiporter NhaA [Mycobacterium sp.]HZA09521.1 Na+/H+ antiporter NhaA [Mycobacterium sp.]